jgi:outer membrane lipoprotein-sorting protein
MKRLLCLLFSAVTVAASAQNAGEVIEKYAAGMGGVPAFTAIKSANMTGTVAVQGMELPITLSIVNGHAMRTDVVAMGQKITSSYIDGKGWKVNPFIGVTEKTEVTGSELADFKTQASLINPLMNYKAAGHKVEYVVTENVDGVSCFKIKLTSADDGSITNYWISSKDYTLVKSESTKNIMGEDRLIETYYSDFKTYGGLKFSMVRTQKMGGEVFQTVTLTTIDLNPVINDKIFTEL